MKHYNISQEIDEMTGPYITEYGRQYNSPVKLQKKTTKNPFETGL